MRLCNVTWDIYGLIIDQTDARTHPRKDAIVALAVNYHDEGQRNFDVEVYNLTDFYAQIIVNLCLVVDIKWSRGRCSWDDRQEVWVWREDEEPVELQRPLKSVRYMSPEPPTTDDEYDLHRDSWGWAVMSAFKAGHRLAKGLEGGCNHADAALRLDPSGPLAREHLFDLEDARRDWLEAVWDLFHSAVHFAQSRELRKAKEEAKSENGSRMLGITPPSSIP